MSSIKIAQAWIIGCAVALATLNLVACSGPDDRQMVQTARNYLSERNVREAALELRGALQKNPDNAEARYLLGQINLDLGDSAAAEKEFRRALKAGWQEDEAQVGLARALINANKFQDLVDEVEIKEDYLPITRANLYGLLAAAQFGLGDVGLARETLAAGADIEANAVQLLKTTIKIQLSTGDPKGAASTLKQALTYHPDNSELLLLSGTMATQTNDQAGAMEAYRRVIELDPANLITVYGRQARLKMARLEIQDKNLDLAQSALAPLLKMNPDDPEVNYLGGILAFAQDEYAIAEQRLLKVLKVAPEHSHTHLVFGTVNYAQQDYEQAAYYIAKYVNAVPENLGARKLLGRTYMLLGQHDEAQEALQVALDEEAEDAELLALVGLSRLQGGDTASGIEGLEHALKVAPESLALRGELAKAYISTGEAEHAIQELKTILAEGGETAQTETLLVIAHLRAGNFDQAINTVLEMLARKPEDPAVLTLAGNVFAASDDKPEARKYFNAALQGSPGFVPATLSLADLEERQGNYAEAATLYKGILDSDPESSTPLLALARLAEKQGKREEMLDWLEQARERSPRDIKPRVMLAEYYLREMQTDMADLMVKEAIKIEPRQPTLLILQGKVLIADRRYNEALPFLNELITREPESAYARTLLADTYLNLGQIGDARRQLEIALEKQPYYVAALAVMAGVELISDKPGQALVRAEQIQKIQPNLSLGYALAGDAWMANEDYAKAVDAYVKAWDIEPSAALALKQAKAFNRSSKPEAALVPLLAWLDENPDDTAVLLPLGLQYQNIQKDQMAVETYERLLALQPDNVSALNNLALLYSRAGNPEARDLAERAYRINPESPAIQDTYGWILVQQGQVDQGRRLLEQAMEKLSEVPEVRYHYAVALLKSGEKTEAHKLLNQLLQEETSFEGREDALVLLVK